MDHWSEPAAKAPGFVWADAWVLASVAVGGGLAGCRLKDIIAAGDLINRAIINAAELRGALGKLMARGFVEREGDSFVISGEARRAVERLLNQRSGPFSVMQFFEELLDVDSYAEDGAIASSPDGALDDLTDARIEAAAGAYHDELGALWRELRKVDRDSLPVRALRLVKEASEGRRE